MNYQIFVIDPPWLKSKGGLRKERPNQGKELDYPTMPTEEIFKLLDREIFSQAADLHCVFMWTIEQYLIECEYNMAERGYKRHCRFIWDKTNGVAPAFTIRYSHEYLIWYYKPKMIKIAEGARGKFKTVFQETAREHSRKPECSYKMIEQMYPTEAKIDVFSREKRAGWMQFGNQTSFFDSEKFICPKCCNMQQEDTYCFECGYKEVLNTELMATKKTENKTQQTLNF